MQGIANLTVGVANDAGKGSGYVTSDGYTVVPFVNGNTAPDFADVGALITGNYHYGNLKPPFPATGFMTQAGQTTPVPFTTQPGGFPGGTNDYELMEYAFMAVGSDVGLVSLNGDVCSTVYGLLKTRFHTAPCTGLTFSGTVGSSYGGGVKMFPAWAIVPALS